MKKGIFVLTAVLLISLVFSFAGLSDFKVFKTIQTGKYTSLDQATVSLNANQLDINYWGMEILKKCSFSKEKKEVSFVNLTLEDFGFNESATYKSICEKGLSLGLKMCQPEDAIYLREVYKDQKERNETYIAMEPITNVDSSGDKNILSLGHNGDSYWINGIDLTDGMEWNPGVSFIFRLN